MKFWRIVLMLEEVQYSADRDVRVRRERLSTSPPAFHNEQEAERVYWRAVGVAQAPQRRPRRA